MIVFLSLSLSLSLFFFFFFLFIFWGGKTTAQISLLQKNSILFEASKFSTTYGVLSKRTKLEDWLTSNLTSVSGILVSLPISMLNFRFAEVAQ